MSNISLFKNISSPENPEIHELIDYLELTRDGYWEDIVNECRLIKDKDARDAFKRQMPTASLSGEFTYRKDSELKYHSGYINIDYDHVENIRTVKQALQKDKYTFAVFYSTSGDGLRHIIKIDPARHREAFIAIATYMFENYGLIADRNGINVSKPYCVSFDPGLYINPETPVQWNKYIKERVIKKVEGVIHNAGDFEMIMKQIVGRNVDIAPSYDDWCKLGFAISEQFGEAGRNWFHDLSRPNVKYNSKKTDDQYNACLKAKGSKTATISTFYYFAKAAGIQISSDRTTKIVRTTRNGKQAGLKKEGIIEILKTSFDISDADELVEQILNNSEEFKDGDVDSILPQLEMFINNNYELRMNEVTGYIEQHKTPLSTSDLNTMFVAAKKLIPKLDFKLMMHLLKSDFVEKYNPFFEFFGSDGIPVILPANPVPNVGFKSPLIDLTAHCIKNHNPAFTQFFFRKWFISIISAAHRIHSPLLLCLLGRQNTGKTEFFRRLMPPALLPYYAESKLDREKDDEILMTENLLIVDDELGGKSKQDTLKLNNMTSKQWYSLRRPYGDRNEKILRLAVLCGTSNYKEILSDPTGNRRIIPLEVDDIDKELYNSIDKTELFMEAFRLYKEGFDWRITADDILYLNKDSVKYEHIIKENELIAKYYEPSEDDEWMMITEMVVEIEELTRQKMASTSMTKELEKMGFRRKTVREGPYKTTKKWGVRKINRPGVQYFNAPPEVKDTEPPF